MKYEFAIVGAGIAGASCAAALAPFGKTLLIERESAPGYHATGRSAALFTRTYGAPLINALAAASAEFLHAPPGDFVDQPILRPRGALYVAAESTVSDLREQCRTLQDQGANVQWLDQRAALARVPVLTVEACAGAMFEPDAQSIDVALLHQGYIRQVRHHGGNVICDKEYLGAKRENDCWRIRISDDTIEASLIVNAAGAWADDVALRSDVPPIGITPKRRTVFTFRPDKYDFTSWPFVVDQQETLYFKPESDTLLVSPMDETPSHPCDAQPEDIDVAEAVARLEAFTTLKVGRIAHKWAGLRSFTADGLPVAGYDPDIPGFFWLVGQGGWGIKTSPGLSQAAAALIRRLPISEDMLALGINENALSPGRLTKQKDCNND